MPIKAPAQELTHLPFQGLLDDPPHAQADQLRANIAARAVGQKLTNLLVGLHRCRYSLAHGASLLCQPATRMCPVCFSSKLRTSPAPNGDDAFERYSGPQGSPSGFEWKWLYPASPGIDLYEMFAFCASSQAPAVGQLNLGTGVIANNIDLQQLSPHFDKFSTGHSAQFYYTNADMRQYWQTVVNQSGQ